MVHHPYREPLGQEAHHGGVSERRGNRHWHLRRGSRRPPLLQSWGLSPHPHRGGPDRRCPSPSQEAGCNRPQRIHQALWQQHRPRSEEHTSELQSLMRISYAVFCLKKKKNTTKHNTTVDKHKQTYASKHHTAH